MSTERNKQAVRDFFEATAKRDGETLSRLFAEDVSWQIPQSAPAPFAGTHHGHDRVLEMFLQGASGLFVEGTHTIDIELMVAEGDIVAAEVQMNAKTTKGPDYRNQYVFLFTFRDGKIAEFREHLDTRYAAPFLDPD